MKVFCVIDSCDGGGGDIRVYGVFFSREEAEKTLEIDKDTLENLRGKCALKVLKLDVVESEIHFPKGLDIFIKENSDVEL